jgi:hypothetical protein
LFAEAKNKGRMMTTPSAAAGGAAGIIQAIRTMGIIIRLEPADWSELVWRREEPLVVHSIFWFFGAQHRYMLPYKGLIFYAVSRTAIDLPEDVELVEAGRIWIPGSL